MADATLAPVDPAAVPGSGRGPPTVTLTLLGTGSCGCIRGRAGLSATATADPGGSIVSLEYQYAPEGTALRGAGPWTTIATIPVTGGSVSYNYRWTVTNATVANGAYDIRVIATDDAGLQGVAVARDQLVANPSPGTFDFTASLRPTVPASPDSGTIQLGVLPDPSLSSQTPAQVTFYVSPADAEQWTPIGTVTATVDAFGARQPSSLVLNFDTTTLPDGVYDFTVTAPSETVGDTGANQHSWVGGFVRGRQIVNTPPTVSLNPVAGTLSGSVTLSASAAAPGSTVASVRFEIAPAGTGQWDTVAVALGAPYAANFDTRGITNGTYDLRAVAYNLVGLAAIAVQPNVVIANGPVAQFDGFAVTNYVAPAGQMQVIGEIAGSPDHEAWAIGVSSAQSASAAGMPLPFTHPGAQFVLLRYTDEVGWAVADVLRNPDGTAYSGEIDAAGVTGQMLPSGEAWLALPTGTGTTVVVHRSPDGAFVVDSLASVVLGPIFAPGATLRLISLPDGSATGILVSPGQPALPATGIGAGGYNTALRYGVLSSGVWALASAQLPPDFAPVPGETVSLETADVTGTGAGWAALERSSAVDSVGSVRDPLLLARFDPSGWYYLTTGLDALDLTALYANRLAVVLPVDLRADSGGVWIRAQVETSPTASGYVTARYDAGEGRIVASWCDASLPIRSLGCGQIADPTHPAAEPAAVFDTSSGRVAVGPRDGGFVAVNSYGFWTDVAAPGFSGRAFFLAPDDGWLSGSFSLGRISATPPAPVLAVYPEPNRSTLVSVALPPGASGASAPGALAVGLSGTLMHYDPAAGWQVDPVPVRAHGLPIRAVAFNGPSSAFAVGQVGLILHWDGTSWSEDPASVNLTTVPLVALAFGSDGQGWAVGDRGTILHYDGSAWSIEQIDQADAIYDVTSVAVAGSDVFAVVNGHLIQRAADGTWAPIDPALLPSPAPPDRALRVASGLPDGGLVVAGQNVVLLRDHSGAPFTYAPQPIQGIAVAVAAYREPGTGALRAFVSLGLPVYQSNIPTDDIGGFPSGDGDLLRLGAGGWQDLSRSQYPTSGTDEKSVTEGNLRPDPVLAVATSIDGTSAWAVGGYAGTVTASGQGSSQILPARPIAWQTASIWRYDAGGPVPSPEVTQATVTLPAVPGTVSFGYFSSPVCYLQCSSVEDAQPDVNLVAALSEISSFAAQPGGPAFAMLGGDARGPIFPDSYAAGDGAADFARLPGLLAALGSVPLFAAHGPLDAVPTSTDPLLPWAEVFGNAPAPFGNGSVPGGFIPVSSGALTSGLVHRYYSFDAIQNGGDLRVIVLDNSAGSLEKSSPGQTAWLDAQLADADALGLPIVVIAARPLYSQETGAATDGDAIAQKLVAAGVLAVFTENGATVNDQISPVLDQVTQVPYSLDPLAVQIPEYEGATLTYQQPQNNGVMWYDVTVDTVAHTVNVQAIPVITGLALKPALGLVVDRSATLSFSAIGRRPAGTLATTPGNDPFPGYDSYVEIPAAGCSGCLAPSYTFTSSDPTIGDFVLPAAPGSLYPLLNAEGHPTPSSTSGLFCAYNPGTVLVSVTSGLLTASLPVTVRPGAIGSPCGTVVPRNPTNVIYINSTRVKQAASPVPQPFGAVSTPTTTATVSPTLPVISLPAIPPVATPPVVPPPPAPLAIAALPAVIPASPAASYLNPPLPPAAPPVAIPLIPVALTPVPPGGASASAQASARREERARKHASQSAYTIRPSGVSAADYFLGAVGVVTALALFMVAVGLAGPRPGRAAPAWAPAVRRQRPRRRYP